MTQKENDLLAKEILSKLDLTKHRHIWVLYHDHHTDEVDHNEIQQKPVYVCYADGYLVYEDEGWIKLCSRVNGVGDIQEEWEILAVRKGDIVRMRGISET